ncbi:hypothetical protein ACFUJU_13585 [Streptomyces sp. NPDC057235]|uniref:hypothetical protein n=1 Tax=Streptomyces sp. NPDC057235 TaxID=3346058 RepID=UPI0036282F5D
MDDQSLISFGGGGASQGCPITHCERPLTPFATDREAVEHIAGHSKDDMAWALLEQAAIISGFLDLVGVGTNDDVHEGRLVSEEDTEEVMKSVDMILGLSRKRDAG